MFVYEVGLLRSGGFWIIHSSPLFPPDMNGKIITNTSDPIWESVLQHSPNDRNDLYFVCVSIGKHYVNNTVSYINLNRLKKITATAQTVLLKLMITNIFKAHDFPVFNVGTQPSYKRC